MIYNMNHNMVNNYIITGEGESEIQIDLTNFSNGTYQTALIIDGIISDSKYFIKQ